MFWEDETIASGDLRNKHVFALGKEKRKKRIKLYIVEAYFRRQGESVKDNDY